jgi:adenosine kinase
MCSETKNNAHPSRTIVFFGSPLVDVTTRVGGRFLERYKLQPDNAYRMDETLEAIFDEIAADCSLRIGGSVTNTVRIFRKLSPSLENVAYFGAIGRDSWGLLIKKQLEQEGIGADLNEVIGGSTGRVAVLLVDKARTLVTDLGASQNFALDKITRAKLDRASHVYISVSILLFYSSISHLSLI